ncbi:hypothetical protein FNV43_RR10604 [Rhamnella rubrinervis]|uniref:Glycosyltransferase n=1 Tax=Rhamnella rubrinervis TaxID=2594499 RepID=A0A8K0H4E4_9ROSA|nr:hypothetical protein FNV43_RR10604 [Rhamnella rubrinervis]
MQDTIVLYAAPGMGHIISMVELSKLILHHYPHKFTISILITNGILETPAISHYIQRISNSNPFISFHRFPLQSIVTSPTNRSKAAIYFEFIRLNLPNVRNALNEISKTSTIKAFIIDLFCTSALSLGMDFGIPTFYFHTSGASALAAFLYLPKIHEQTTKSFRNLTATVFRFRVYGIIANTFDGFEPVAMNAIQDGLCVADGPAPSVYYVGPLISTGDEEKGKAVSSGIILGAASERGSNWVGKEWEKVLWVLKKPTIDEKTKQNQELNDFDLCSVLPEGFAERTRDLGMVVKSWVPQVEVLKKESVGGFVTHCGWNSVLEAVVAGVPMIAWPLYAEQHLNRTALVEDIGMAIPVEQREEDGFVSGAELEKRVRELMESEKGRELGER